jgi:hypothetical protein
MTNAAIKCNPDKPTRHEVNGGYYDLMEFEDDIWVMHLFAEPGKGVRVFRHLISYAKDLNKNLYGNAEPDTSRISRKKLKLFYEYHGAEPITMTDNPHAMRLRCRT